MRDEIMRLAERVESIFSDVPLGRMEQEAKEIAAQLRALARTDHVEDKLGVVPEALKYHDENKFRMIDVFRQKHNFARGWNACRDAMLAASPAPDHSAGVGGMVARRKRRVFVDMDGVIVDFDAYKTANNMTGDEVKLTPGAYLAMPAIPGAIEAVRGVIGMGFDVWIATKPPTGVPYAYSDKAAWIMEHLPELKRKIIITHDKGLLGDSRDFLCDDRPHKANCERFAGSLLRFVDGYHWPQALDDLRAALAQPAAADAEGGK